MIQKIIECRIWISNSKVVQIFFSFKMRLIILSLVIVYVCEAYKILVIFPFPTKSHAALGNGVVRHLLNAGHEVS